MVPPQSKTTPAEHKGEARRLVGIGRPIFGAISLAAACLAGCLPVGKVMIGKISSMGGVLSTPNQIQLLSNLSFGGITSVSGITATSLTLHWTNVVGASSYAVYNTTSGLPIFLGAVVAPITFYTVTGLAGSSHYTFAVEMIDTKGLVAASPGDLGISTADPNMFPAINYSYPSIDYVLSSPIDTNIAMATGGTASGFTVSSPLPAGLNLDHTSGQITGTPTALSLRKTYTITATINSLGVTTELNLGVRFAGLTSITSVTGNSAQLNWSEPLGADPAPASYSVVNVSTGLIVQSVIAPASSTIVTGLAAGTAYTYEVRMLDTSGIIDQNTVTRSVSTLPIPPPAALSYPTPTATYTLGETISPNIPSVGSGVVSTYTIQPSLPAGLAFNSITGQITGTPTQLANTAPYTVRAVNAGGATTTQLQLTVNFAGISSITNVTGSSVQLNWALPIGISPGVANFQVFEMAPNFHVVQTLSADHTSAAIAGLGAGMSVTYGVRMIDTTGVSDQNSVTQTVTTLSTAPPTSLSYAQATPIYTLGSAITPNNPTHTGGVASAYSVSPPLPTGLSLDPASGQITGTPTRLANTTTYTLSAANAGGSTATTLDLTVNFAGIGSISNITGSSMQLNWALPAGASPGAGSFALYETAPSIQLLQSVSGTQTSAVISGLNPGTNYTFSVQMIDSSGSVDQNSITQSATTLASAPPAGLSYAVPSPTYVLGSAITPNDPTNSGGAVDSYTISPALPAGLSLDPTTGQIAGTPTQLSSAATYTVTATNAGGSTTASLNLAVNFAGISSLTNITGSSMQLNWTLPSGASPAPGGFRIFQNSQLLETLSASTTSTVVTGLDPATSYTFQVRMVDSSGVVDQNAVSQSATTLATAPPANLTYATPSPIYTLGVAVSADSPTSSGGSVTSYAISPALPGGLGLNPSTGQLTGTPTQLARSTAYTITATNAGGSTTTSLNLAVNFVGIGFITNITGSSMQLNWGLPVGANPGAASFSILEIAPTPQVVQSVGGSSTSVVISGLTAGTQYIFAVRMVDTSGTTDQNSATQSATTLSTNSPAGLTYATPAPTYTLGTPVTANNPSSVGGAVTSYAITPSLPAGLSFSTTTGQITGTPTVLSASKSYTVSAMNAGGSTSAVLNLGVNFVGISSITNVTGDSVQLNWPLPSGASLAAGSFNLYDSTSGTPVFLESVNAPANMAVINGLNAGTAYKFRVRMVDTAGNADTNTVDDVVTTLSTAPPGGLSYSTSSPTLVLGTAITPITASYSGGTASSFSISPALPAGLNFSGTSGQITGTPSQLAEPTTYTLTALNAGGSTSTTINLQVNFAGITSITGITGSSLQVNWAPPVGASPAAASYNVVDISTGMTVVSVGAPGSSAVITGLAPGSAHTYAVRMVDSSGIVDQNTLTQSATTLSTAPPTALNYTNVSPTYTLGSTISTNSPTNSGGIVASYAITPPLPSGLSFSTTTGQITGTPTQLAKASPYTVSASNAGGSATTTLTLSVNFAGITSITNATGSSLQLNWVVPSSASPGPGSFLVFETAPTNQLIETLSGTSSSVTLSGLNPGTTYSYEVRMTDISGVTDQNNVTQSATTLSTSPPTSLTYATPSPTYTLGVAISPNSPSSSGGAISSYSISPALPAGLSLSTTTGQITGTPTQIARSVSYTITATNAGGSTIATLNLQVNFAGITSITNVTGNSLQVNWINPASANPAAASFSVIDTSTNVTVQTVSAPTNSAVITGLTAGTTHTYEVRMIDTSGVSDQNTVTQSATTVSTAPPTALSYATPSPIYTLGVAISSNNPTSSGGAVASYTISPALPAGLSLSTSTGHITGTPTQLANANAYTVSATNAGGSTSTTINLTVNYAGITSITNVTGSSLQLNWALPTGANPGPASFEIFETSPVAQLVVSVSGTTTSTLISGLSAGTSYTYKIQMVDSSGVTDQNVITQSATTNATAPPSGLSYATPSPVYTLGVAISSNNPTSSGGAVASYAISPALPAGLSFSTTTGHITGTPTQLASVNTYTVSATNAGGSTSTTINLAVNFAGIVSISSVGSTSMQLNWALPTGASPGPGSFQIYETSPVAQLVQSVSGTSTSAMISGLSTSVTYTYAVRMVDTSGLTDTNTVTQSATTSSTTPPSGLSYATPSPTYTLGTAITTNSPTVSGGTVSSYSINPALPGGLSLNTSTGQITGTPTALAASTAYTVSATNAGGSSSTTLNLAVNYAGATSITSVTGSSVQLNWTNPGGASPAAASFSLYNTTSGSVVFVESVAAPATSAVISGLSAGTAYKFRVHMVDTTGTADANTVDISTTTNATSPPASLTYATPSPTYTLGVAISPNSPSSSGGAVSSYSISPALPAGLSLSTTTGQITGTPTQIARSASYTITATNAGGSTTATLNLQVNFAGITSITNVTGNSLQVNWVNPASANPAAASFSVIDTSTNVTVQTVSAPTNSAVITGLTAGTTHTYEVRMIDTSGVSDQNTVTQSATTVSTAPPTALSYATPSPIYTLGVAISSNNPTSSGGAVASYTISPALPAGLSLSTSTGHITGTPTQLANANAYTVSATNAGGSTSTTINLTVNYAGITSITNVTGSSLQLNWALPTGANPGPASFEIFETSPVAQLVVSVSGTTTSTLISGLSAGTSYTYKIQMVDSSGVTDQNVITQSATTNATAPPSGLSYATPSPVYTLGVAISSNNPTSSGGAVASYAISPALPAGLSFSTTTGHITGTPTQLANANTYTVSATNAGGSTSTTINLAVNFAGIVSISSVGSTSMQLNWALPTGASPGPGSFQIYETSPVAQLVQSVSGTSTSAMISGLSTSVTYTYAVRMVDTSGLTDTNTVTQSATTSSTTPPSGLSYATPSPTYTLGTAITTNSPTVSGGTVSSYSINPALPGGLSLNTSTGQITGTPTALAASTAYTVSATNAGGSSSTTLNLAVNYAGATSITSVTGSSVQLNWTNPGGASPAAASFSLYNTTSGSVVFVESVAAPATSAVISGLSAGTAYKFRVHMVDTTGTADANTVDISTTTNATSPPASLTYATPSPTYTLGVAISPNSPSSSGGAVSSYSISPALPAGLSLSTTTGQITGTPTQIARSASYTITATNAGGSTTATLNLQVNFAGITSITNVTGNSLQVNWVNPASANPAAASFSVIDTSTNVTVQTVSAPTNSAVITGLTAGTTHTYEVRMIDTSGVSDQNTVTQSATTVSTAPPTALSYATPSPIYTLGVAISSNNPTSSGGAVASYTISPALPAGLSLSTSTGHITGTPTQLANANAYTVSATNAGGSTSTTINLTVNYAGITSITNVTGSSLQLNWALPTGANPGPASFEIFETSPVAQLVVSVSGTTTSTLISGLSAGTSYTYKIQMVDSSGVTDQNVITQSATTNATAPPSGLSYATPSPVYTLGVAISSNNPTSSGGAVASYAISPALPAGLSFSTTTGHITGTPTQLASVNTYTVSATNAGGSTSTTINLAVNFAGIVSISSVGSTSMQLNWALPTGASPGPGSFQIYETSPVAQLVQSVSGTSTSAMISGLSTSVTYTYAVRMVDTSGLTDTNTVTQSATTSSTTPPSGLSYATPSPTYTLGTAITTNSPTVSGGTVSSYSINPALPGGLSLNTSTGQITGTPTALAASTAYTVSATNAGGSSSTTLNLAVNYAGATSITSVTGSSVQLNWTNPGGASPAAASFSLYNTTSGSVVFVESVAAPATSAVISGLSAGTAYKFRVHMVDTTGTADANTVDISTTTNATSPPASLTYATPSPTYTLGVAISPNSPSSSGGAVSSYSISPALPAGLSLSTTTGQITGTPTQIARSASYTITATNAGGSTTATLNLQVNFAGITSITNVTGNSLQVNWVNPASANPAAASFSVIDTSTNVTVQTVSAPTNSAVITGLTAGTTHTYEVRMIDTSGVSDQNTVTQSATTVSTAPPTALSYATPSPIYTLGVAISSNNPTSSGGAVASYTISPALPAGLSLSTSTGHITGTPTQLANANAYTVSATNAGGSTSTTINLTVNYAGITSITNVTGSSLQLNWALPTGANPGPASFEIFETSPVAQLVVSVSGTTTSTLISGLSAGTSYTYKIQMVDSSGVTDQNVITQSATTNATAPPSGLSYATPSPVYTLGVAISSNNPTSSGGAVASYAISPALPAGLSFSTTTGHITGTPTQLANANTYTVSATNAGGSTSTTINLTVNYAGITSITSVTGSSLQLNWALPTGASPGPASFEIFETLPVSQLVQSVSGTSTSTLISGLSAGTSYTYKIQMVDSSGVTDQNVVTQSATTNATAPPSGLSYATPSPVYTLGVAISSNNPTSSGGAVASYAISPPLPGGLNFSTTTGHITGTPTQLTNTAYTVTATNAGGSTTATVNLMVNYAGISSISNVTGSSMQLNWALPVGANPGVGSFEIFETAPLSQLVQTASSTATSAIITGLNTNTSYTFEVRMVDTSGVTDQNIVTQSATTISTAPPMSLSFATPSPIYTLGAAIASNNPSSSGGAVASYAITPALPAGLSLSTSTGHITGTPTRLANNMSYTVTATNAGGSTTAILNLTVNFAGITSISSVTGSSMQLNWVLPSGASPGPGSFEIFETAPVSQLVQSVSASSTSSIVSGLASSTNYTYEIHMVDTSGVTDQNVVTQSATTLSTAPPSGLSYATPTPTYTLGSAITTNSPSSSGGSVSAYAISPTLPAGLSFSTSTGQITGTPIALASSAPYTVTATNAGGSTSGILNLAVNYVGINSITNVTGSSAQLNWVVPASANPASASFNIYNTTSGSAIFVESVSSPTNLAVISGLAAGTAYKFRIHMVDTTGTADQNTVDAQATTNATASPTSLSYTVANPTYPLGSAIATNSPSSSGGVISSYSISPALPGGLSFNTTSGQITGTPSQLANLAYYTVTATNAGGSTTTTLNLSVNFSGIASVSNVSGNSVQVNWASPMGANPAAASFSIIDTGTNAIVQTVSSPATSAVISGLTAGSSHTYAVHMNDTSGITDQNTVTQTATLLSTSPPTSLTYSQMNPTYFLGTAITTNSPSSSGGSVASYAISPALPTGLNLNTSTGQITGTPTRLLNATAYVITATNAGGSTTAALTLTVNFAGITSITPVGPNYLQVNWALPVTASVGPSDFLIYNAATSPPTYLGTAVATSNSYAVTGLSAGAGYQFLVRMVDTSGVTDTNLVSLSVTTPSVAAAFQGWSNVTALGMNLPAPQATDLSSVPANVTLSWNAVSTSGSVSSYTIYRGTTSGAENYGMPLATGISTSSLSYKDSTVASGVTYYYTIAPVISGVTTQLSPGMDNEIAILIPPNNMALIHPWVANQEICGLMGRSIDRTNNYRCSYVGPGNINGYYNNTRAYFVDVNVMGCLYSRAPACGGADCIGTSGAPSNSLGSNGNVYYDRYGGGCYYNTGGSWSAVPGLSASYSGAASNASGLPPLTNITQPQAYSICTANSVSGYTPVKRLLRHREQVVMAAWSSALSDSQISNLENGSNLYSTYACNSNNGSGLTYSTAAIPSDLNTLPGEGSTGGIYSVRTGSTATTNCISRYGVRDTAGNVEQWTSDQLGSCNSTTHSCQGITSTLDSGNTDWNGFNFDGTIGPGGGSSQASTGYLYQEDLGPAAFSAFQAVLGLPMISSAPTTWDYLTIGTGAGQFNPSHFHYNAMNLYTDYGNGSPVARGSINGGDFSQGSSNGRYLLYLQFSPSSAAASWGFRCMLPIS